MKLVGIAVILFCGAAIAKILSTSLDSALANARSLCELIRHTRTMVDKFSMRACDILIRCSSEVISGCGYAESERPNSFGELLCACRICDAECSEIFKDFCSKFGRGYREEELRECEYYLELMEARTSALEREVPAKKKMIWTMILSGAVMLAILFV